MKHCVIVLTCACPVIHFCMTTELVKEPARRNDLTIIVKLYHLQTQAVLDFSANAAQPKKIFAGLQLLAIVVVRGGGRRSYRCDNLLEQGLGRSCTISSCDVCSGTVPTMHRKHRWHLPAQRVPTPDDTPRRVTSALTREMYSWSTGKPSGVQQ